MPAASPTPIPPPPCRFKGGTCLVHLLVAAFFPLAAQAHGSGEPLTWAREWGSEPVSLASLFFLGWLYAVGYVRLRAASPRSKLARMTVCFAGGWLVTFIALESPLHPLGQWLFSAHMCQHELLMVVAAPLLVLGRPGLFFLWALPRTWTQALARARHRPGFSATVRSLESPLLAWLIHAVALWIWHLPSWFQATLTNEWIHAFQHISFLGTALLFWQAILRGPARRRGFGVSVLYLLTTAIHSGALGALLTLAPRLWYPAYADSTLPWGLAPLEDQQLGGLIMWIPGGLAYVFAGLVLFAQWLKDTDKGAAEPSAAHA